MVTKINGAASAQQNLAADLQYYICYASSPLAYSDPNPNPPASEELTRLVNIQVTSNPLDDSQKNFEILIMSIALRAMPVILSDPIAVAELSTYTTELSGEGYMWKFAVERNAMFYNYTPYGTPGPVGLLIDDIDGVIINSGVRLTTVSGSPTGWLQNISFSRLSSL